MNKMLGLFVCSLFTLYPLTASSTFKNPLILIIFQGVFIAKNLGDKKCYLVFPMSQRCHSNFFVSSKSRKHIYTHTHTHTHIYIYIE